MGSRHQTALHRDDPVQCATCGKRVERRARQQRFCGIRCRERGKNRTRKSFLGSDTGAPPNPPKKLNGVNGLQAPKSASSVPYFIHGYHGFQLPGAVAPDHATLAKIIATEIGRGRLP